MFSIFDKNKFI